MRLVHAYRLQEELVSPEILSILILVVIFIIATTLPINMGVSFAAAVLVGGFVAGLTADDIFAVFPGDLFIVLVGVTYLFGIAQGRNGTVDGWCALPSAASETSSSDTVDHVWVAAVLTAVGAASPPRSRSSPLSRWASPPSTASVLC